MYTIKNLIDFIKNGCYNKQEETIKKWVVKNDYFGFIYLSDEEKDELMGLVIEYVSTEPEKRN